jgi:hypothetical protein
MSSYDSGSSAEVLYLDGDVPRRFVHSDTRENRESWFIQISSKDYDALRRSLPIVVELPPPPAPFTEAARKIRREYVQLCAAIGLSFVPGLFHPALTLVGLLPIAFALFVPQHFLPDRLARIEATLRNVLAGAAAAVVLALTVLGITGSGDEQSGGGRMIQGLLCFVVVALSGWAVFSEIKGVKDDGADHVRRQKDVEYETARYRARVEEHRRTVAQRESILEQIARMERTCLHPRDMATKRTVVMDEIFLQATAELNVSPEDAHAILAAPGERFLEIVAPKVDPPQKYPRPVIRLSLGLTSMSPRDTPIIQNLIAHRYDVILALILQQGLGIVSAVYDSVEDEFTLTGHDLLLWKSISRITRRNSGTDSYGDEIVLETFGGSVKGLPVNGMLTQEWMSTIPVVSVGDTDGEAEATAAPTREVNSFVREIQTRIGAS